MKLLLANNIVVIFRKVQSTDNNRRSLTETAMYRMKTLFGPPLKTRCDRGQSTETKLKSKTLNHFTKLDLPKFIFQ